MFKIKHILLSDSHLNAKNKEIFHIKNDLMNNIFVSDVDKKMLTEIQLGT